MKKIYLSAAILAAMFFAPALAQAAEGVATANVNMRSGPSTRYPAVVVIPYGVRVNIHGCLSDRPWCDVSFAGGRGWVSGQYVQTVYQRQRVYVAPQYYRPLGIPTITFDVDNYWDRNYRNRNFYRDRSYWRDERARNRDRDVYIVPQRDRVEIDRPRDPRREPFFEDGNRPPRRDDGSWRDRNRDRDRFQRNGEDFGRDRDRDNRRERETRRNDDGNRDIRRDRDRDRRGEEMRRDRDNNRPEREIRRNRNGEGEARSRERNNDGDRRGRGRDCAPGEDNCF